MAHKELESRQNSENFLEASFKKAIKKAGKAVLIGGLASGAVFAQESAPKKQVEGQSKIATEEARKDTHKPLTVKEIFELQRKRQEASKNAKQVFYPEREKPPQKTEAPKNQQPPAPDKK